jgi:uncharacterized protein (DUF4415 family)
MPEESEVEGGEDQDDANIRYQPFPESVSEEGEIYTDDDGCHHHRVQQASYSAAGFRRNRHWNSPSWIHTRTMKGAASNGKLTLPIQFVPSRRRDWIRNDMPKIVRKTMAEAKAALAGQQDELKKLRKMPDRDIDLSELPELTETFWQNAVPNPLYRPVKKQITLRIDADILAWLRQQGPEGYQSRLNALLRSVMLRDLESKRKRA